MLRVSKLTDYATVLMSSLTRLGEGRHSVAELSNLTGIAQPTTSKLLKQLHHAGLVESERGPQGGYQLASSAENINVAQIVEAIEGPIAFTECSSNEGQCGIQSQCSVRGNWQIISQTIVDALQSVSLQQLSKPIVQTAASTLKPVHINANGNSNTIGTEVSSCR